MKIISRLVLLRIRSNVDAYSHSGWLATQDIHIIHGAPILLSKFQTAHDFKLIDYLGRYNGFVWFNRPSRVVYDKKKHEKAWWAVEASFLDQDALALGMRRARKINN